jgi:NADH-quinone oxidoreductase subunit H
VAIATGRAIGNNYTVDRSRLLLYVGIALVVFVGIMLIPSRQKEEPSDDAAQLEDFDPFAGGHPVPPMPWQERQVVRPAVGARTGEADDE